MKKEDQNKGKVFEGSSVGVIWSFDSSGAINVSISIINIIFRMGK